MIRINILPHRDEEMQLDAKLHLGIIVFIIFFTMSALYIVNDFSSNNLDEIKLHLSRVNDENALLKRKIGKIRYLNKLRHEVEYKLGIIETLQDGRFRTIKTLNSISKSMPKGVWMTDFSDSERLLYVDGVAINNEVVADFLRGLEKSPDIENVSLTIIQRKIIGKSLMSVFSVKMSHVVKGKKDDVSGVDKKNKKGK